MRDARHRVDAYEKPTRRREPPFHDISLPTLITSTRIRFLHPGPFLCPSVTVLRTFPPRSCRRPLIAAAKTANITVAATAGATVRVARGKLHVTVTNRTVARAESITRLLPTPPPPHSIPVGPCPPPPPPPARPPPRSGRRASNGGAPSRAAMCRRRCRGWRR